MLFPRGEWGGGGGCVCAYGGEDLSVHEQFAVVGAGGGMMVVVVEEGGSGSVAIAVATWSFSHASSLCR